MNKEGAGMINQPVSFNGIIDNKFLKLVKNRRSTRRFIPQIVEREKIVTCIEAARLAPSAENVQPWRFVILDDPAKIQEFSKSVFSGIYRFTRWAEKAPVIIVIFAELDWLAHRIGKEIQGTQYYLLDIGIAGEHLVLQAEQLGLASCWIGWFNARKAKKSLGVPRPWKATALLTLGYPQQQTKERRAKKKLEDILFFNGYNSKK
jgi:nitroreductase